MGKKGSKLGIIALVGAVLVIVGFCLPVLNYKLAISGKTFNGFDFINTDNFGMGTIGAIMIFAGACLQALFCVVPVKKANLVRLICLIVSVAGGVLLVLFFNDNGISQAIGKHFLKNAYVGFYMIVAGWVVSLVGVILKK